MRFKNKVALVTGAESGIGLVLIKILLKEGCNVIATTHYKKINVKSAKLVTYKLDVTQEDHWINFLKFIKTKFKAIDILINNAGIRISGSIEDTSLELWNHILKTNTTSLFLGTKYILPLLKKSKNACIVNSSSVTGIRGVKNMLAYATSKSALTSFTSSLALDLSKDNIRVNAVAPGAVKTGMTKSLKKDMNNNKAFDKRMIDAHPLGRMATSQEIAKTICFLASEDSSFITGIILPVDGGRSVR